MTAIKVENLTKRYGDITAVDDISFIAEEGELTSLVGPSGCGKTTTLRCVAGLERPEEGRIIIGDKVVTDPSNNVFVPPHARDIGFVFQTFDVWPHMTVFENVAYPLRNRNYSDSDVTKRVQETLELTSIADQRDKPASQLSGGQQARVGICRAIVYEPSVLLFDEPLTGLDRNLRKKLRYEIKRIQTDLGITSVYVTHSQPEAMTLSDKIALMNTDGKIEQMGSGETLYKKPESWFAFEFFGSITPFQGKLLESGLVETESLGVLKSNADGEMDAGDATIGLRPDHIDFAKDLKTEWDDDNTFEGIVEDITFLGGTTEITASVDGATLRVRKNQETDEIEVEDRIFLHVDAEHVYAFRGGRE